MTLPSGGFDGEVPGFPLPKAVRFTTVFEGPAKTQVRDDESTEAAWDAEQDLWEELWQRPQAFMWAKLGLKFEVAAYVRAFLESVEAEASAGLKTAVLRMGAEIGLSLPGMHSLRWKFSVDELEAKRAASAVPARSGPSARERMAALSHGK